MRPKRIIAIAVALFAVTCPHVAAQIENGDFEGEGTGWRVAGPDSSACGVVGLLSDRNLPLAGGSAEGRRHLAALGPHDAGTGPDCETSILLQRFQCDGDASLAYTTVSFDAACWSCGDDEATVMLQTSDEVRAWRIPCTERGETARHTVSVLGSGDALIAFALWRSDRRRAVGAARDVATVWIDNVTSYCGSRDTSTLLEIATRDLPLPPPGAKGLPIDSGAAPDDCNANGTPDVVELCADPGLDKDHDATIDNCDRADFNWKLLLLGLLVLIPTLMRLGARQRSRHGL